MSSIEYLESEVAHAIKKGDYRSVMILTKYHLKRKLTSTEIDDLTKNCLRWSGTALAAARLGASGYVIEGLITEFISDGDGVSAGNAAELNGRTLTEAEVDKAVKTAIKERCAFSKVIRIVSLGISKKYLDELLSAYRTLQEDTKCRALMDCR